MSEQNNHDDLKRQFANMYDSSAIGGERGLLGVRSSPSQYLGSGSIAGARQALIEILQNSVDEGAAFLNFMHDNGVEITQDDFIRISIAIDKDDNVVARDTGRGVPPDFHKKFNLPTLEVVFEEINIGGKGKGYVEEQKSAYKTFTIGKHGSGAACANATADYFYVNSKFMRDDEEFEVKWDVARKTQPMHKLGPANGVHGTTVSFRPSKEVFKMYDEEGNPQERFYDFEWFSAILTEYAYNAEGIILDLEFQEVDGEWNSLHLNSAEMTPSKRLGVADDQIFSTEFYDEDNAFKVAVHLSTGGPQVQIASVNMLPTKQGTHIEAMESFINSIEKEFLPVIGEELKTMGADFDATSENLRRLGVPKLTSYVNYYISASIEDPDYSGQSKERLSTPRILNPMTEGLKYFVGEDIPEFKIALANRFYPTVIALARNYIQMKEQEKDKEDQAEMKDIKKQINKKKRASIKGANDNFSVFTRAREQNLRKVVLYILEGSTAYNAFLSVRYAQNESVYALSQRPINVLKYPLKELRKSEKFNSMYELFYGDKGAADYGTIILAGDPDEDGEYINMFNIAMLVKFFPDYIKEGKVFVFEAYKYIAISPTEPAQLFKTMEEAREFTKQNPGYYTSQFKGLGSVPNHLLRQILDDVNNYIQLDPNTLKEGQAILERALMSTNYKQRYVLENFGTMDLNVHYLDRKRIMKLHEIDYDINDMESGFTTESDMSQIIPFRSSHNLLTSAPDEAFSLELEGDDELLDLIGEIVNDEPLED